MGLVTKTATQTVIYYYGVFINSLIVTVMLCGGYDIIIDKIYSVTNIQPKDINNNIDNKSIEDSINKNDTNNSNEVN